jgi:hypothetical protein
MDIGSSRCRAEVSASFFVSEMLYNTFYVLQIWLHLRDRLFILIKYLNWMERSYAMASIFLCQTTFVDKFGANIAFGDNLIFT